MNKYQLIFLSFLCAVMGDVVAERYDLPTDTTSNLIGEIQYTTIDIEETLLDIGRRHGFGYYDMKLANLGVDTWLVRGVQKITLPSRFILPDSARAGIVLNIPEMRLYYYPKSTASEKSEVITYPLGVGREGWQTPYIKTSIVEKKHKPNWYPPKSIREEYALAGEVLPTVVRPGADNPLGEYAMRLGKRDYLIHGTNKPYGVGMRVSHGCIRLYPEDIAELYQKIPLHTTVRIINQPYKVGFADDVIYLEAHPYLIEDKERYHNNLTEVLETIVKKQNGREYIVDWGLAYKVINEPNGMPIAIGMYLPPEKNEKTLAKK